MADQLLGLGLVTDAGADGELWKPHAPTEECPVCLVPLPLTIALPSAVRQSARTFWSCCGKTVCYACDMEHQRALAVTNAKRATKKLPPQPMSCAFCRSPQEYDDAEIVERYQERSRKGDTEALCNLASFYSDGSYGLPKNDAKAYELLNRAADLGCVFAQSFLGQHLALNSRPQYTDYWPLLAFEWHRQRGEGMLISAAKGGDVAARHTLGVLEDERGNHSLAIKHYQLAAAAGLDHSMKALWSSFHGNQLSKVDLQNALRAHQAACDEMNSEERERCQAWKKATDGNDTTLRQIYDDYYGGAINAKELKKLLKAHQKSTSS